MRRQSTAPSLMLEWSGVVSFLQTGPTARAAGSERRRGAPPYASPKVGSDPEEGTVSVFLPTYPAVCSSKPAKSETKAITTVRTCTVHVRLPPSSLPPFFLMAY
jgi:hypothetical protein